MKFNLSFEMDIKALTDAFQAFLAFLWDAGNKPATEAASAPLSTPTHTTPVQPDVKREDDVDLTPGPEHADAKVTSTEPVVTDEQSTDKPKRKRRTKAEIAAEKAASEGSTEPVQPDLPFEGTAEEAVGTEPDDVTGEADPSPSPDATPLLSAALGAQASVAFPSPNDFLRASYAQDKDKARTVCAAFIEEVGKAALADLTDEEKQTLCHKMVDAGFTAA